MTAEVVAIADAKSTGKRTTRKASSRKPAAADPPAAASPATDELVPFGHTGDPVSECQRCGFEFKRPQRRHTCQSQAACDKRRTKAT